MRSTPSLSALFNKKERAYVRPLLKSLVGPTYCANSRLFLRQHLTKQARLWTRRKIAGARAYWVVGGSQTCSSYTSHRSSPLLLTPMKRDLLHFHPLDQNSSHWLTVSHRQHHHGDCASANVHL